MSYQLALCSRIVRTGDMASALKYGITIDDFTALEARNMFQLVHSYYVQQESQGSVITERLLQTWFKGLVLHDDMPQMTMETLCYEVRRERIIIEGNAAAVKFSEAVNVPVCNPVAELGALHTKISSLMALGVTANSDVTMKMGMDGVLEKLRLARQGVNNARMSWPWEILERATFGLQPDDYVVFYGRPKSMKTWVLCYLIAWAFENEKRILVYTKEMTPDNVYMRVLACILRFAYDELREAAAATGKPLQVSDEAQLMNLYQWVCSDPRIAQQLVVLSGRDAPPGGDTVSWLNSKIDQYHPDILFVDGSYLLSDQRKASADHTRVMNISRDLRQMNLATRVPIISTLQANRKAAGHSDANFDEIAYSDAIGQDATVAARVINDKASPTISIILAGSREFKLHGFRINGTPARDFTFHSELTEKDILKAKEADQVEAEKEKAKKETVRAPKTGKTANGKAVAAEVINDINTQFKATEKAIQQGEV